jgi:hypothetical protein
MVKSSWIPLFLVASLVPLSGAVGQTTYTDDQIRTIANQYTLNLSKRDNCKYTPEDLYESAVANVRAQLNAAQTKVFQVSMEQTEVDPSYDIEDHASVDETWCKEAKEKLKKALGK